jgi:hypothetical protein
MRAGHWAFHVTALAMIVLAVTACATGRGGGTAASIQSVQAIAGTWTGTVEFGSGEQPCTLIIEPSGRATVQARTLTANGTVTVQGGKATYDFPARSQGTVTLYQDGTKRELNLKGMGGVFDMWVTPK